MYSFSNRAFFAMPEDFAQRAHETACCNKVDVTQGTFKKLLSGFFPLRGSPPPTPPPENHFSKKPLAEMGGSPPPLNGKSAKIFRNFVFLKGLKMMFLY